MKPTLFPWKLAPSARRGREIPRWMESLMEFAIAALALGVLLGVLRILGGILQ